MNRRYFLFGGVASAALVASGAILATTSQPDELIAQFVRAMFPKTPINDADLATFAQTMEQQLGAKRAIGGSLSRFEIIADLADMAGKDVGRSGREIVTKFARSTDLFNPDRGTIPVTMIAFSDPYEAGCSNPLPGWTPQALAWPDAELSAA